jgi:N-methylhydantoinase A
MQCDLTRQLASDGVAANEVVFERAGDPRYVGQGYELRVPFSGGRLDQAALEQIFARFAELHRTEYGHMFEASPIEIVNIRVTGIGRMPKIAAPRASERRPASSRRWSRPAAASFATTVLEMMATPFYGRNLLPLEQAIAGPAIALQTDSTTVVPRVRP